jgi:hypothetical protein
VGSAVPAALAAREGLRQVPFPSDELASWIATQNFVIADELADAEPVNRRMGWIHLGDWFREQSSSVPFEIAAALVESFISR